MKTRSGNRNSYLRNDNFYGQSLPLQKSSKRECTISGKQKEDNVKLLRTLLNQLQIKPEAIHKNRRFSKFTARQFKFKKTNSISGKRPPLSEETALIDGFLSRKKKLSYPDIGTLFCKDKTKNKKYKKTLNIEDKQDLEVSSKLNMSVGRPPTESGMNLEERLELAERINKILMQKNKEFDAKLALKKPEIQPQDLQAQILQQKSIIVELEEKVRVKKNEEPSNESELEYLLKQVLELNEDSKLHYKKYINAREEYMKLLLSISSPESRRQGSSAKQQIILLQREYDKEDSEFNSILETRIADMEQAAQAMLASKNEFTKKLQLLESQLQQKNQEQIQVGESITKLTQTNYKMRADLEKIKECVSLKK